MGERAAVGRRRTPRLLRDREPARWRTAHGARNERPSPDPLRDTVRRATRAGRTRGRARRRGGGCARNLPGRRPARRGGRARCKPARRKRSRAGRRRTRSERGRLVPARAAARPRSKRHHLRGRRGGCAYRANASRRARRGYTR